MKPLQISPETAIKLAAQLKVPLEHLMHMPQHILLQKLAELAKSQTDTKEDNGTEPANPPSSAASAESDPSDKPGEPS